MRVTLLRLLIPFTPKESRRMLFFGYFLIMASARDFPFASPQVRARVARHSASLGWDPMLVPSSLTLPIRIGILFALSAIASLNDLIVIRRPSTVGPEPTRGGLAGPPGPRPAGAEPLILAAAALAAPFNLAQSIFWSEAMSVGPRLSSFITCLANSRDASALGGLPPPPDWMDAR